MPRQTSTGVTSGTNTPYTTQPQVGLQVIPRAVEDKTSSLEGLSRSLNGFFGDVGAALGDVQEAEHLKTMVKIEQENQTQQWEAKKIALEGGDLNAAQLNDLDFVTPYNETRAGAAAVEDAADFALNVLPTVGLDQDAFGALSTYMGTKLKGIENKQFAAFYMDSMLRGTSDAIAKNRAQLFQDKQVESQNDWKSVMAMELKTGQITDINSLMHRVTTGAKLYNPMNPQEGERWAVAQTLQLARTLDADGTIFNQMTELLQQPVDATKDNPQGLSFATRFPDAYDSYMTEWSNKTSAGWDKQIEDQTFKVNQSLAAGDLNQAMVDLQSGRGLYGDNKSFRGLELQITAHLAKGADAAAGEARLLNVTGSGLVPEPDDIRKYGDATINKIIQTDPVRAAALMTSWNAIPPDLAKTIEGNLTKSPESAAAYYTAVAKPLFDNMPATLFTSLDENAEFVLNSMHRAEVLGNTSPTVAAQEAIAALNAERASGMKASTLKLWDDKPGAQAKYMESLRDDLASTADTGGFDPGLIHGVIIPAIQERTLRYMMMPGVTPTEAAKRATEETTETALARVSRLPAADGGTYAMEDVTPASATKWQKRQLPDGTTYDPVEQFRTESDLPEMSFVNNGEPLGLVPGNDTKANGGMDVVEEDGVTKKVFQAGMTIEVNAPGRSDPTTYGTTREAQSYKLTLPADPVASENMLTEMFGNTGFRLSSLTDDSWTLQYVAPAQPLETIEDLSVRTDLENALGAEQMERKGGFSTGTSPGFKAPGGESLGESLSQGATFGGNKFGGARFGGRKFKNYAEQKAATTQTALRDATQEMVSRLQDSGLVAQSEGVTKPLPLFGSAEESMNYVNEMINRAAKAKGGMPLEAKDALIDDKYLSVRSKFLRAVEGVRNETYDDTKGNATVGVGINLNAQYNVDFLKEIGVDTDKLKAGKVKLTDEQVHLSFENAVNVAEAVVTRRIKVPLNAFQRTALVSMVYNGPSLLSADLVAAVNSGDWPKAVKLIAGKSINKSRRKKEATYLSRGVLG